MQCNNAATVSTQQNRTEQNSNDNYRSERT